MPRLRIRYRIFVPRMINVLMEIDYEKLRGRNVVLPDGWSYVFEGWSDNVFIYDDEGQEIMSFHQLHNAIPVEFVEDARSHDRGEKPRKLFYVPGANVKDPRYGLIPTKQFAVVYEVDVTDLSREIEEEDFIVMAADAAAREINDDIILEWQKRHRGDALPTPIL
jgi:hypothetical protein